MQASFLQKVHTLLFFQSSNAFCVLILWRKCPVTLHKYETIEFVCFLLMGLTDCVTSVSTAMHGAINIPLNPILGFTGGHQKCMPCMGCGIIKIPVYPLYDTRSFTTTQ